MGSSRVLATAGLAVLLEPVDPLACPGGQARASCLPRNAEALRQLSKVVIVELVVFDEPCRCSLTITPSQGKIGTSCAGCVTYVPERFDSEFGRCGFLPCSSYP